MKGRGTTRRRALAPLCGAALLIAAVPGAASAAPNSVDSVKKKAFSSGIAVTSKKKKAKAKVTTGVGTVPITSPPNAAAAVPGSASAACGKKTHVTGGGYNVAPPVSNVTGIRSYPTGSNATGPSGWSASIALVFPPGSISGTFTAHARCESSSLGKVAEVVQGTAPVAPGGILNMRFNCKAGNHVVGGGFTADPPATGSVLGFRILILGSRRTGENQWTVTGFNNNANVAAANMSGFALCEKNGKGRSVSEVTTTVPIVALTRATAAPSCSGKKHAVSGGFNASIGATTVPLVGIDEHYPTSKKAWHSGLWAPPQQFLPAEGSTLTASAYCKKDTPAAKKKKK
jgi:hypothetical protein